MNYRSIGHKRVCSPSLGIRIKVVARDGYVRERKEENRMDGAYGRRSRRMKRSKDNGQQASKDDPMESSYTTSSLSTWPFTSTPCRCTRNTRNDVCVCSLQVLAGPCSSLSRPGGETKPGIVAMESLRLHRYLSSPGPPIPLSLHLERKPVAIAANISTLFVHMSTSRGICGGWFRGCGCAGTWFRAVASGQSCPPSGKRKTDT